MASETRICSPQAAAQIARSEMDISSDVALSGDGGLAGVDPHADPELDVVGPGMRGEGALGGEGADERVVGAPEGVEEGVSLGVDLDAAMSRKGVA